jgi:hypothetical protein
VRHTLGEREASPDTIIVNLALVPFLAGEQPVARFAEVDHDGPLAALVPETAAVTRRFDSRNESLLLVEGPGWTGVLERRPWSESTLVTFSAVDDATADAIAAHFEKVAPKRQAGEDGKVPMRIWHYDNGNFASAKRMVEAAQWAPTAANYPSAVRAALAQLMELRAAPTGGRLLLWHGEPGTGKTTAIRCLARAWADWADTEYVIDPERFFEHSDYLFTVLTHEDDEKDKASRKTRLIVVEDADQFLTIDAKRESGHALGRLLNLTDGIVGHGLEALVLITTNEPLSRLHPAVTRPGRCLSNIEFGRFSRKEAAEWLGADRTAPSDGATLAQLFEMISDTAPIVHTAPVHRPGNYV